MPTPLGVWLFLEKQKAETRLLLQAPSPLVLVSMAKHGTDGIMLHPRAKVYQRYIKIYKV